MVHMAGLAVGITVHPAPGWTPPNQGKARRLHLYVDEGKQRYRAKRALGFVLQRGAKPPQPDSVEIPGSVLVLTRGQPTDIVVTNRLREAAAIHWHGVELLSYSDGVAGWSGDGQQLAPVIAPGDSFTAHLLLPRAGTFIYHTHLNDLEQLSSGLYGAIVVLEPGQRFDPLRDHVFVAGWDSPNPEPPRILINGDSLPAPLELKSGVSASVPLHQHWIGAARWIRDIPGQLTGPLASSGQGWRRPSGASGGRSQRAAGGPGRGNLRFRMDSGARRVPVAGGAAGKAVLGAAVGCRWSIVDGRGS